MNTLIHMADYISWHKYKRLLASGVVEVFFCTQTLTGVIKKKHIQLLIYKHPRYVLMGMSNTGGSRQLHHK